MKHGMKLLIHCQTVEIWEWISNFTTSPFHRECYYLSIVGLKLKLASERGRLLHISNELKIHWGRERQICVSELTIIGSDKGLSPGRRQAIIWTNAGIMLIGPLGTNFSEILIEIYTFSFEKMYLKMLSRKWRPSCLGLNVLMSLYKKVKVYWFISHYNTHPRWVLISMCTAN